MDDPFDITVGGTTYSVFPDFDDFAEKFIYGIEINKNEVGILQVSDSGEWEWAEGGDSSISPNIFGQKISLATAS